MSAAHKPIVIIVEGEIGAGKTEFVRALTEELQMRTLSSRDGKIEFVKASPQDRKLNVCAIFEPVDVWSESGALDMFYKDPKQHAYTFQTFASATRILAIADAHEKNPAADVFILERSPATDAVFWHLQGRAADSVENKMYSMWCDAWKRMLPFDLSDARVLYLHPSLECCMARLISRSRKCEVGDTSHDGSATGGVSIEYQQRLRDAHHAFLLGAREGFEDMGACPFRQENIFVLEPVFANLEFRVPSDSRDQVIEHTLRLLTGLADGPC